MSKFFFLGKKMRKSPKRSKRLSKDIWPGIKVLNLTILGLTIFVTATYLIQINKIVAKSYQIKDLETEISRLEEDARSLQLESLNLQSMDIVAKKISQLNMVAVDKIEYLQPTPLAAAR